jgi:hypothetical protein
VGRESAWSSSVISRRLAVIWIGCWPDSLPVYGSFTNHFSLLKERKRWVVRGSRLLSPVSAKHTIEQMASGLGTRAKAAPLQARVPADHGLLAPLRQDTSSELQNDIQGQSPLILFGVLIKRREVVS